MSAVAPQQVVRHPLTLRHVTVVAVRRVVPAIVRVTLGGPELTGFASDGPGDHVKVFFPDPVTGTLTTPEITPDGPRRPSSGTVVSRDYTPLAVRVGTGTSGTVGTEVDLDFVLHGDEGPASAWADRARVGDQLAVAGPRGSRLVPEGIGRLILVADETALPAVSRWLRLRPRDVGVVALLDVADDSVTTYLDDVDRTGVTAHWLTGHAPAALEAALRALGPLAERDYVALAGEATTLVPLRRYLRRELGLPREQVSASGYWRRGVVALDHHAPLDESDPD